ncbi:sulfotransferase domain-containing protein [Nocardioides sp.]|uniref:sulfotransferase domain-containing protein n=1 Tax=Nocardioides sp. TaxID=35761 RepID=UPI0025E7FAC4|nr:sulfotransferase domain-containing protein [Nocardioides sp.]
MSTERGVTAGQQRPTETDDVSDVAEKSRTNAVRNVGCVRAQTSEVPATQPMTGLVDFFVVGAQKAGTTALAHHLQRHPGVEMSWIKEPHFFDDEAVDWSDPDYGDLHAHFPRHTPGKLRGEATPIYSYWPPALARLHDYNPAARLVIALRQPALRAYSHWRMEIARNLETMSFADATSVPVRERVRRAPMGVHRIYSYVERGFYADQIERAFELFSPTRVHFLRTDQLWSEPVVELRRLESFLSLEEAPLAHKDQQYIVPVMAAHVGAMRRDEQAQLTEHFAEDIRRTAALTGLCLDDWLDEDYREPMAPPLGRASA